MASEGRREVAASLLAHEDDFLQSLLDGPSPVPTACREAQNAVRVARASAVQAIETGNTINAVIKQAEGKQPRGQWNPQGQACLRSAILFAGAGVDRSLKQLVADALPELVKVDNEVQRKLQEFGERHLTSRGDQGVDPKNLVRILLGAGTNPRDIVVGNWIRELRASSAQSAERVQAISQALAVVDDALNKRVRPTSQKSSALERAFIERNRIAHELDIVEPNADTRKGFERLQQPRKQADTRTHVRELLDVAQGIINDVAARLQ